MGICSKILNGLINECSSNQGGLAEVWIASLDFPLQIIVDENIITYIGDGSSIPFNPFVKYEFKKGNASMSSTVSFDTATNQHYVSTDLKIDIPKLSTERRIEIENLINSNNLAAIVGDKNGKYWFLGLDYPMVVTASNGNTGSNRKDKNGYSLTFNCCSKEYPLETTYLPWQHRPKPPHPIIVDYEVSVFGTTNKIDVTSDWFKDDKLFTEDDYYEVGSIVTVNYKGSENFLGWYDGKTKEFQSQYREYTFRMPKKDVVLVGMIAPILPPPPTKFYDVTVYGTYGSVTNKEEWFEDENTLIGTDGYSRGSTAIIEYVGDKEFEGWYIDGTLVSSDKEYSFEVTNNVDIVAKLSQTPPPTPHVRYKYSGEWYTDEFGDGIIPSQEYQEMDGLTDVVISYGITSIGDKAFSGCGNLTNVSIGNSVESIGERAFYQCTSLTEITIPNSVTSISPRVFYRCSSLTSVTIGNSVTSIGNLAFYQCSSLTSVTIGNSVTSIGDKAFNGVSASGKLYCDEVWYNNLDEIMKTNLGVVYTNWIPYFKVDSSAPDIGGLG